MNLEALREICKNNPEILEQSARDNKADPDTVNGIARFAIENGYEPLSVNQKYHFCVILGDFPAHSYAFGPAV